MSIESDFQVIDLLRSSLSEPQRRLLDVRERLKGRYIQTDWDDDLRAKFDTLLRSVLSRRIVAGVPHPEARLEARCLVVTGEAGTGKTESLDRLFRTHPVLQSRGEQRSPLIRVTVPAPCTLKTLGRELLRAPGYPLSRELADHIIWARIHELLPAAGVLLIHLDEMHNLTDGANSLQLDNIRKALKGLMVSPDWPVGLIISGLPGLVPEMRRVDEIRRRGQFVSVPLLQLPRDLEMIEGLILGLAEVANVEISNGQPTKIAPRLIHAALYRLFTNVVWVKEPEWPQMTIAAAAKRTCCSAMEIVRLILDRRLRWVGSWPATTGFPSLLVDVTEVKRLIRSEDSDHLTMGQAADMLGTTDRVLSALVESKVLSSERRISPKNRCPYIAVPRKAAEAFKAQFTSLHELARGRSKHMPILKRELASRGIEPALTHKQVMASFYRRSEIPPDLFPPLSAEKSLALWPGFFLL